MEDKLLQPKSRRGNGSKPGISGSEIGGDAQRHRAGRCEVPLEAGKQRLERRLKFGGAIVLTLLDARWKAKRNVDKPMIALVGVLEAMPPVEAWPLLLRLQQEWPTSSVQVESLLKQTAAQFGITEEELKARALLKPKLDIDERVARMMDRLNEARVAVPVAGPAKRLTRR